jgi:hypothetical protein
MKHLSEKQSSAPITADEPHMSERRAAHFFRGRLETDEGWVECDISNLAVRGAKLTAAATVEPSQHLSLVIEHCDAIGAKVLFQHDGTIGVRFTDDPEEIARTLAALRI